MRDHSLAIQVRERIPVLTLVGGKLTTSRAFGELAAEEVLKSLCIVRTATTIARVVPGGTDVPATRPALEERWGELSRQFGCTVPQIAAMWALCGSRVAEILESTLGGGPADRDNLCGSNLPRSFARWVIEHEWVTRIEDLLERRLMLIYERDLSHTTIGQLADLLIEAGRLDPAGRETAIERAAHRCRTLYGRRLAP